MARCIMNVECKEINKGNFSMGHNNRQIPIVVSLMRRMFSSISTVVHWVQLLSIVSIIIASASAVITYEHIQYSSPAASSCIITSSRVIRALRSCR